MENYEFKIGDKFKLIDFGVINDEKCMISGHEATGYINFNNEKMPVYLNLFEKGVAGEHITLKYLKVNYACYSEKQSKLAGIVVYKNFNDEEVFCTHISDTKFVPDCKWDDKIYLGEVFEFVRRETEKRWL